MPSKKTAPPSPDSSAEIPPAYPEAPWLSEKPEKSQFNEAEILLNSLKDDFLSQSGPDKLLLLSTFGMLLSCFFPWKTMAASGDVLGFLSISVLIIPLAIGSVAGMLWRKSSYDAFPILPWALQGLSGLLSLLFCLVLAKVFWVNTPLEELTDTSLENSKPAIGLLIGLMFSLLNLAATGLGVKRH